MLFVYIHNNIGHFSVFEEQFDYAVAKLVYTNFYIMDTQPEQYKRMLLHPFQ